MQPFLLSRVLLQHADAHQVGDIVDTQLCHQACLVHFNRAYTDSQLRRDIAIVPAGHDQLHHFLFAWRQFIQ